MKFIPIIFLLACSGCAWAPNSWNATWYQDPEHAKSGQAAFGLSGPIPQFWNK